MTYIYDILLNFEKEFFEFFEWNKNDKIIHIKKIPIIKISNSDFNLLKNSIIRLDRCFLNKIYNKTETNYPKKKKLLYAFLISNGQETIALKLNKNGVNIYKSSLILEDEEEITIISQNLKEEKIKYNVLKYITSSFKTRNEKENEKRIIKSINKLYRNKENKKLKFLYLECFNKKEKDLKKIYNKLKNEAFSNTKNFKKMNDFFSLNER